MRPVTTMIAALGIACLAGCAAWQPGDERRLAERDHAACMDADHDWPSAGYERCRWKQQEERNRRTWRNFQMMERPQIDQGTLQAHEPYRSLPRAGFTCRERIDAEGHSWVDCGFK